MCVPGTLLASSWSRPCFSLSPLLSLPLSLPPRAECMCLSCHMISGLSSSPASWSFCSSGHLAKVACSPVQQFNFKFPGGKCNPAWVSHSPLAQSAVARGWGPPALNRGLRTDSLRWDSSAGGPLGMDPQVPHSFAPGLPGNLGKTESELSLRTEKIGSPPPPNPRLLVL